jgi:FkbM family methyltransferase
MFNLKTKARAFLKTYIFPDRRFIDTQRFKRDDYLHDLRGTYDLDSKSVVLDLGGYNGEWTQHIFSKYSPAVYIFEPVEEFYNRIVERFKDNSKIQVFNFGLGDKDEEVLISLEENASSVFAKEKNTPIKLRDISEVMRELNLTRIDLIKINIEGGEFQVLPRLIEKGLIERFINIQVQFHHFYPDSERLREEIRSKLSKTHHLTYDYPFVFENWRKND